MSHCLPCCLQQIQKLFKGMREQKDPCLCPRSVLQDLMSQLLMDAASTCQCMCKAELPGVTQQGQLMVPRLYWPMGTNTVAARTWHLPSTAAHSWPAPCTGNIAGWELRPLSSCASVPSHLWGAPGLCMVLVLLSPASMGNTRLGP